jgi:hypothetical protein
MLYRAAMIGIIAFWLVMMGLLVRLETHPEATDILDVPVSYVMRLLFKHGQISLLTVSDQTKAIGDVSLRPLTTGSDGRSLNFSGTLTIQLPTAAAQRFNFYGVMDMDAALQVRDFHVDLSVRESRWHLSVNGDATRKILTYEASIGDQRTTSQTLPMDASALSAALGQNLGLDLHALPITPANITPPAITARETEIALRGEQLEVYEVTVTEGTTPMIDFYVTQLGQVVLAKTSFGYNLAAEEWQ